jgi:hypothetical protein
MISVFVGTVAAVTFMMLTCSTDHLGWKSLWALCSLGAVMVALA